MATVTRAVTVPPRGSGADATQSSVRPSAPGARSASAAIRSTALRGGVTVAPPREGHDPSGVAGREARHPLARRPLRQARHEERDGQHEQRDPGAQLDGGEAPLAASGHGNTSCRGVAAHDEPPVGHAREPRHDRHLGLRVHGRRTPRDGARERDAVARRGPEQSLEDRPGPRLARGDRRVGPGSHRAPLRRPPPAPRPR